MHNFFPNLRNLTSQVTLPAIDTADILMWEHTPNGELTLAEAYKFKNTTHQNCPGHVKCGVEMSPQPNLSWYGD